jgi:ABC-type phosphate transport system permease subunit
MLHEGMSVEEIAENLPLSLQEVSSALGVTNTSSVIPVAVPQASSAKA